MSVKVENIETNKIQLTIDVTAEEVNKGIQASFKKNAAKANVPGFRKGKVPFQMFVKMFGIESLYPDAIDQVINEAYTNALIEEKITPVDYPEIEYNEIIQSFKKDEGFTFVAKVTVRPVPTLGQYKGLEIKKFDLEVTEENIENELKQMQARKAEWVLKEEGVSEQGDIVVIDFEGFEDGVPFEGGKGTNYELELGSNSFIPGFEEQLVGKGTGEEVEVNVSFPEEYHAENLAGKPVVFKCTVHEIKTKALPELTDEFAKDIDEKVSSLEELKVQIKDRLTQSKLHESKHHVENSVVEAAVANATVEVPEAMVKNEQDYMVKDFERRMQMQGMTIDLYYQYTGQDEAALREQMKPEAEKHVRTTLVLDAIAKAEGLEVTPEEVTEEINSIAVRVGMSVKDVVKNLGGNTAGVENDIKTRKVLNLLVDNCKTV
ncbi:MAG: trigger factor [Bacillales bacterium]|jgi:trigger factor|nr:trigger factor [Bacillales bacterium]